MPDALRTFIDHSRHTLRRRELNAVLDVLAFEGEETLSQPFRYTVQFTSPEQDIGAAAAAKCARRLIVLHPSVTKESV